MKLNNHTFRPLCVAMLLGWMMASANLHAEEGYRLPPQPLVDIIDAAPTPSVRLSPDREWMLLTEWPSLPPIAELAERELRIAGLRIKPQVDGPSRSRPAVGLSLLKMSDRSPRAITGLPAGARIESVEWSPDGGWVSFTNTVEHGNELWVVEVASGAARRLTGAVISLAARERPTWSPDSQALIVAMVPEGRGGEPVAGRVPKGPVVQENLGRKAPARTYQDLLKTPHDEALFEYYLGVQLARVDLTGAVRPLGEPGLVWSFDPSPDGRYILNETIHRPFSYLVPANRFPLRVEILDATTGRVVHQVADLPLRDEIPIGFGSVSDLPRGFSWRDDAAATLVWQEALDGGDVNAEAENRDRVLMLAAPFGGDAVELATLQLRYAGIQWGDDNLALVSEFWWKTRKMRTWMIKPGTLNAAPELLFDRSFEDRYSDPGRPLTRPNAAGRPLLWRVDGGNALYYTGVGASAEGDRPFLDKLELATQKTERLFHSSAPFYERPLGLLDDAGQKLLTRRESVEDPPNYYVRDLATGSLTVVTHFTHPTPQLEGIQKEQIRYQRADGVDLTGTLYLPAGYKKSDGPLPTVLWAYPQEFKSAAAAGQVTDSPYRFDRVGWWSPLLFLTRGYAVLDDPTLPIVGEGDEEPNDTFVDQLVSGAKAAIDELVRRGVTDPRRVAIGGHSYGAFMTANLLAHSDLFAAGIARSGAYNRTLTPFGFQAEERTVWQAPEVYAAMSPFMHADKVNEPLLMIHGQADNNSGTFPMQSERFYNALKGLGGTTRLVMLPHESHGYRARESIMHMLWETSDWLDTYVKNREPASEDEP